jgi:hypothetical protein
VRLKYSSTIISGERPALDFFHSDRVRKEELLLKRRGAAGDGYGVQADGKSSCNFG